MVAATNRGGGGPVPCAAGAAASGTQGGATAWPLVDGGTSQGLGGERGDKVVAGHIQHVDNLLEGKIVGDGKAVDALPASIPNPIAESAAAVAVHGKAIAALDTAIIGAGEDERSRRGVCGEDTIKDTRT